MRFLKFRVWVFQVRAWESRVQCEGSGFRHFRLGFRGLGIYRVYAARV